MPVPAPNKGLELTAYSVRSDPRYPLPTAVRLRSAGGGD